MSRTPRGPIGVGAPPRVIGGVNPESFVRIPLSRISRALAWVGAILVLWLASIEWPIAPTMGLDSSWECALVDAHLQGRLFGTEVQFTYGPWGYLASHFALPGSLGDKMAWEFLGLLGFSVSWVMLSSAMAGWRRAAFLALVLILAGLYETGVLVQIVLISLLWLVPEHSGRGRRLYGLAWLAFFSQQKFTFLILSVACVGVASASAALGRRWRAALALVAGYAGSFLTLWLLGGQRPGNLPAYLRASFEISRGYSAAMGLEPGAASLAAALCVLAIAAVTVALAARRATAGGRGAVLCILGAGWFLAWKEAFTRADLHSLSLFFYSAAVAVALIGLHRDDRGVQATAAAVLVLSAASLGLRGQGYLWMGPAVAWERLRERPREILRPGGVLRRYSDELHEHERGADDPLLRRDVGEGRVDALTIDNSRVVLNGLRYHPRPVCQSYSAYTPSLAAANAAFFSGEGAPAYATVTFSVIDGHPPAQDDGPSLLAIVRGYEFVRFTPDYTLVHRRPGAAADRQLIGSASPAYGDWISAPVGAGHPVWIEVDIEPTWVGRVRALLYQAPGVRMNVRGTRGEALQYRLVPAAARSGFFLQPWISNHGDFARLMLGGANTVASSIQFECPGSARASWGTPRVRFYSLRDLALEPYP